MLQQVRVTTQDGREKRLWDWNPRTRELTTVFGSELLTFKLAEDELFELIQRVPKKKQSA